MNKHIIIIMVFSALLLFTFNNNGNKLFYNSSAVHVKARGIIAHAQSKTLGCGFASQASTSAHAQKIT